MKNFILFILILLAFFAGLYVYTTQKLDIQVKMSAAAPSPATIKQYIKENLQSVSEKSAKCPNVLVKSGEVLLLYNNTDTHYEMPVIFNGLDEYANYVRIQRQNGKRCPVLFLDKESSIQGEDVFRIKSTPFNDYYETFSDLVGTTIPSPSSSPSGSLSFPPSMISQLSTNVTAIPFYNVNSDSVFDPFTDYGKIEAFNNDDNESKPTVPIASPAPAPVPTSVPASIPTPYIDIRKPNLPKDAPYNKGGYPPFDPYGQTIGKYTDLDKMHDSTAVPPLSDNPMDPNWGGTEYTKDAVDSGKYIENNVYPVNFSMPGSVQFYPGLYQTYPDPPNYVKTVGGPVPPYLQ